MTFTELLFRLEPSELAIFLKTLVSLDTQSKFDENLKATDWHIIQLELSDRPRKLVWRASEADYTGVCENTLTGKVYIL